jgi:hypothetical protein
MREPPPGGDRELAAQILNEVKDLPQAFASPLDCSAALTPPNRQPLRQAQGFAWLPLRSRRQTARPFGKLRVSAGGSRCAHAAKPPQLDQKKGQHLD